MNTDTYRPRNCIPVHGDSVLRSSGESRTFPEHSKYTFFLFPLFSIEKTNTEIVADFSLLAKFKSDLDLRHINTFKNKKKVTE